jgi:hypothetical protein
MAATDEPLPHAHKIVEEHWPYDGPYSPEHVRQAAVAIERLGRYLNNATGKPGSLEDVTDVSELVGLLNGAVYGYGQLLDQLERFLDKRAQDTSARLYDDRRDREGWQTAADLSARLADARGLLDPLANALDGAHSIASRLGEE